MHVQTLNPSGTVNKVITALQRFLYLSGKNLVAGKVQVGI